MFHAANQLLYEDAHRSNQGTATLRDSQDYEELLPRIVLERKNSFIFDERFVENDSIMECGCRLKEEILRTDRKHAGRDGTSICWYKANADGAGRSSEGAAAWGSY
ncbi:hypothetical protein V6N11_048012 [Hibiscus sabdariffa]|uniref:Uncharacterized protein n=1 Tax=Hibiscus sabdariffa TaxID=183260 RepID=A0ABR2NY06_9ROSI